MYVAVKIIRQKKVNKQEKGIREANNFSIKMYLSIKKIWLQKNK